MSKPLGGYAQRHLEQLLCVGLALRVEAKRRDAAASQCISKNEVEGVNPGQFIAANRPIDAVGKPCCDAVFRELITQQRKEVGMPRADADVRVSPLVAASTVRDGDERDFDWILDRECKRCVDRLFEVRWDTRWEVFFVIDGRAVDVDARAEHLAWHEVASEPHQRRGFGQPSTTGGEAGYRHSK